MELHQLRYFCAVADTGSFSRAAEQSHVSQPSLSQQILKLEDELGARLFDRLGRSVRLTELGKTFLPRARAVLRELEAARGDVVEQKDSIAGSVTIGAIPTVAPYLLPRILTSFSRKFPQVHLTVVEEITPVLLDRLRASLVDIAVLALPIRGHEFESFPLLTEPLFAVLPQKHKLAMRRSISLKEVRKEPFLLLRDGHCFRENAVAACDRARVHPQVIFESGQFSSLLGMVGAGMGVSLIPQMAMDKKSNCRYVPISDPGATRTIGAVVLRGRSLTRANLSFLSLLRQFAK
ncbi:MAG TPA: LysR substrate-binding domain-containing protein [Candidatus Dormibacteraeota bacterium]|jgi:LysR family hydrogen peroxide-inducible transcriptional activator|nr:LysR substrate-binding domain-containing protein [Candidatus Dormibacteraeota bacterium]